MSNFQVGEAHPEIGLYVVEQSHARAAVPVAGVGQIIGGDPGHGQVTT